MFVSAGGSDPAVRGVRAVREVRLQGRPSQPEQRVQRLVGGQERRATLLLVRGRGEGGGDGVRGPLLLSQQGQLPQPGQRYSFEGGQSNVHVIFFL